ncbi:solute carrier family 44 protein member 2 [Diplonema papillatum]|nr:solute carrier family 44 protein member 2 [Diplonema papillatum]
MNFFVFPDPQKQYVYTRARGCADVPCLLLFAGLTCGLAGVTVIGARDSNADLLERGVDFRGEYCATGAAPSGITEAEWLGRDKLWYPLSGPRDDFAVCVEACPYYANWSTLTTVQGYADTANATSIWHNATIPPSYAVVYSTVELYRRCVPEVPMSFARNAVDTDRIEAVLSYNLFSEWPFVGAAEMTKSEPVLGITLACCVAYATFVVFVLPVRTSTLSCAYALLAKSACLFFILFAALIAGFLQYGRSLESTTVDAGDEYSDWWKGLAYAGVAIIGVGLLIVCVNGCSFYEARLLVEEASTLVGVYEGLFLSFGALFWMLPMSAWCYLTIIDLCTNVKESDIPSHLALADNSKLISYVIIAWAWWMGFIHAFIYMTSSFCAVFSYFEPNRTVPAQQPGILYASLLTLKSAGSLAFGTVAIAVVAPIRTAFRICEGPMRTAQTGGAAMCGCLMDCVVGSLSRVLHRFSKTTYILLAILGDEQPPLCPDPIAMCPRWMNSFVATSSYTRLVLLDRLPKGMVLMFAIDTVLVMTKGCIVAVSTLIAWQLLRHGVESEVATGTVPAVLAAFASYVVSSAFFAPITAAVETLLTCYCYDIMWLQGRHVSDGLRRMCHFLPRKQALDMDEDALNRPQQLNKNDLFAMQQNENNALDRQENANEGMDVGTPVGTGFGGHRVSRMSHMGQDMEAFGVHSMALGEEAQFGGEQIDAFGQVEMDATPMGGFQE